MKDEQAKKSAGNIENGDWRDMRTGMEKYEERRR